jgi:hypothetical protein
MRAIARKDKPFLQIWHYKTNNILFFFPNLILDGLGVRVMGLANKKEKSSKTWGCGFCAPKEDAYWLWGLLPYKIFCGTNEMT